MINQIAEKLDRPPCNACLFAALLIIVMIAACGLSLAINRDPDPDTNKPSGFSIKLPTDFFDCALAYGGCGSPVPGRAQTSQAVSTIQIATHSAETATQAGPNATATQLAHVTRVAQMFGPNAITQNVDWTPINQVFNNVEMVQVPAGCFRMGSEITPNETPRFGAETPQLGKESPIHEQCFETAFWIDRTEVTRAMYTTCVRTGNCVDEPTSSFSEQDDQPVVGVNWFQATAYCEWREARLPTEAEWEYAARGPSNLSYAWGNDFDDQNIIYGGNSDNVTAPVGSRPQGASWVGALDMNGNAAEWVSSLYFPYPYDATDGREDTSNSSGSHVLRGGSGTITNTSSDSVTASIRLVRGPYDGATFHGFRCARSSDE